MQAVVVARAVAQQQRRGPGLAGGMAAGEVRRMVFGVAHCHAHRLVPAVRDRHQLRVQRRAQCRHARRERIGEVLVLAAAEAVARHHDVAAKAPVIVVQRGQRLALGRRDETLDHRSPPRIEIRRHARPVDRRHALADRRGASRCPGERGHGASRPDTRASRSSSARLRSTPQR